MQTFFLFGCSLRKAYENLRCKIKWHVLGYCVSKAWFQLLLSSFFSFRSMIPASKSYLGWCRCCLLSGCPCGCSTCSIHHLAPWARCSSSSPHLPTALVVQKDATPPAHIPTRGKVNTGKAFSNPSVHSLGRCQNKHYWQIYILFQWNLKSVRSDHSLFEHRQRWKE